MSLENLLFLSERDVNLSPPWYIWYRKLKASIGADSYVHMAPLRKVSDKEYVADLMVGIPEKAQALADVITPYFQMGEIILKVSIKDFEGHRYESGQIESKEDLMSALNLALLSNDYYYGLVDGKTMNKAWILVLAKVAIQYYSDNISDLFLNTNEAVENVFKDVIKNSYSNELIVGFTTEVDRNVEENEEAEVNSNEEISTPWKLVYNNISAIFSVDDTIKIYPLYEIDKGIYRIDIQTADRIKGRSIATLLKSYYEFGAIITVVRVLDINGLPVSPLDIKGLDLYKSLTSIAKKAFETNPWVIEVLNLHGLIPPSVENMLGSIEFVIAKEIIQYCASNTNDFFRNVNKVAEVMFKDNIITEFELQNSEDNDVIILISTTTEPSRNIN